MNRNNAPRKCSRSQATEEEQSSQSRQICDCDLLLQSTSVKPIKTPECMDGHDCCRCYEACNAALNVVAGIVTTGRLRSLDMLYVGQIIHNKISTKAYILGPLRVDGGIVLFTQTRKIERGKIRSFAYFLDDFYRELELSRRCGRSSELWGLIEKAIIKRERSLRGTTNYFSGGVVVKIL